MAVVVPVEDGKVVDKTSSSSQEKKTSNSALDKEAFLKLLVAQMKYQDPLEPTSNTEYISQLATFSSLEEMQNMRATMEASQATNLVGKNVIMKVTNASGEANLVEGRVDYVTQEGSKTYVYIDGSPYSIDDLYTIVDDEYLDATTLAEGFVEAMEELPEPNMLTLKDKEALLAVVAAYDSLTPYQKKYIAKYCKESLNKLNELIKKMSELGGDSGTSTDKTEGTEGTEGSNNNNNTEGTGNTGSNNNSTNTGNSGANNTTGNTGSSTK